MDTVTKMKISEESIKKLYATDPQILKEKRIQAYAQFRKLDLPSFKYGIGVFATLDLDFDGIPLRRTILSPTQVQGMHIKSLQEMFDDKTQTTKHTQNRFGSLVPIKDKIDAFHYAFCDGIVIETEKNNGQENFLPLSFSIDAFAAQHVLIVVKENTNLTIVETVTGRGIRTNIVEAIVEKNAKLTYVTLQNMDNLSENTNSVHITTKKAQLKENASVHWFDVNIGTNHTKSTILSDLQEQHAKTYTKSVFLGNKNQLFDFKTNAIHHAPHTVSKITSKGCLDEGAKAIYRGLIEIKQDAHKSVGSQKEDTLLLSSDAEIDAIPDLVIHNDDVKCKHGASIGHVDDAQLFYLMTRGLSQKEAKKIIIEGFFSEMQNKAYGHIHDIIKQKIDQMLS